VKEAISQTAERLGISLPIVGSGVSDTGPLPPPSAGASSPAPRAPRGLRVGQGRGGGRKRQEKCLRGHDLAPSRVEGERFGGCLQCKRDRSTRVARERKEEAEGWLYSWGPQLLREDPQAMSDYDTLREAAQFADKNIGAPRRFEPALDRIEVRERELKEHAKTVDLQWSGRYSRDRTGWEREFAAAEAREKKLLALAREAEYLLRTLLRGRATDSPAVEIHERFRAALKPFEETP